MIIVSLHNSVDWPWTPVLLRYVRHKLEPIMTRTRKAGMEMVAMVQVSHAFVFGFALLLACVSIRLVSLS